VPQEALDQPAVKAKLEEVFGTLKGLANAATDHYSELPGFRLVALNQPSPILRCRIPTMTLAPLLNLVFLGVTTQLTIPHAVYRFEGVGMSDRIHEILDR
jgi:hypothetical protein